MANILYVLYYYPICGGVETITITLANEMVKRGYNVHIAYSIEKITEEMPYIVDTHIKTIKLSDTLDCKVEDMEKLKNYIIENNIDIVISQFGRANNYTVKLCYAARLNTKCKLIVCRHMYTYMPASTKGKSYKQKIKRMLSPIYRFYDMYRQMIEHNEIYKMSDKYVFLCSGLMEEYKQLSGNRDKENRLTFIHNAIECKKNNIDFSAKQKEILFVGRIAESHKRLSYILKVWKIVERNGKHNDWCLSIIGDGEDLSVTKEFAQKLQLKNISFEDFQNPEIFYKRASIFLMTSAFEGLPMTLIEAQNFGCVPIAMDSFASIRDIINDGQNGFIAPNDDLNVFTEKVCILMNDSELWERMAKNSIESVKKFSVENIVDKWEKLFKNLSNKE
jgi:glycosyltransferase involved in cell wall biosynthesis